ncbi:Uncharacterised protein [Mycobacteroides abscessus subsp. abscessus]|nr:Uncharacterised protein [Mycobacteroides abscessus subsp. abscessus]
MLGPAPQHVAATAPGEAQHDVLGAAAERGHLGEFAAGQPLFFHPLPDDREIDDVTIHLDRLRYRHA